MSARPVETAIHPLINFLGPSPSEAELKIESVTYLPAPTFWLYSLHHIVKYQLGLRRTARWVDPLRNLPLTAAAILFDRVRSFSGTRALNMQIVLRRGALE